MTRVIRKSRRRASGEAAALLTAVFSAELLSPSQCVWLVSPWISDVRLIDNRAGSFASLSDWGPRQVRISEIMASLAGMGTCVVIGTIDDRSNDGFLRRIHALFEDRHLTERLQVDVDSSNELHEKAITCDDLVITGSMNITNNGIFVREEYLELRTEPDFVARARMDAYDRFGGRL